MKLQSMKSKFTSPAPRSRLSGIKALVLAGGASVRMGRDKGELVYHDQPQKYHLATMLIRLGLDTHISQRKAQESSQKFQYITDSYEDIGPAAGLLSAFEQCNTAWLVVGCDYPLLESQHLRQLLLQRDKHKAATVFSDEHTGFLLPTVAIYEPGFFPGLKKGIDRREYSLQTLLKEDDIKIIKTQDRAFESIDTPSQYEAVKKEIHKRNERTIRNP